MSAGTSIALATVRVPRGRPRPSDETLRQALEDDRAKLHLAPANGLADLAITGPYAVTLEGRELDEYVVWER